MEFDRGADVALHSGGRTSDTVLDEMQRRDIDILMITHRRPRYARRSLERLLEQCDDTMRVWVWHNGDDEETLAVAQELSEHPACHRFHHSPTNERLRAPTNWVWENSDGAYVSKVDDDCLLKDGWAQRLRDAHEANPDLGVIGCWRFQDEDFVPELAERKTRDLEGGHRILVNCWVQGSGYLMKRACVDAQGLLPEVDPCFTKYCNRVAERGWLNGFYFPFLREDHMDDPRSPNTLLLEDADMAEHAPLSALRDGVTTLDVWLERVRWNAYMVQAAPTDPRWLRGWRLRLRMARSKMLRALGRESGPGASPSFRAGKAG
ncbi:MAG: glycosyltransferase family 2 protein [Planctomycetota bacterium]